MSKAEIDLSRKSCSQWNELINEWIYNELHREILRDRLLNGFTYEHIAELYSMSDRQIKRICYNGINQLLKHI